MALCRRPLQNSRLHRQRAPLQAMAGIGTAEMRFARSFCWLRLKLGSARHQSMRYEENAKYCHGDPNSTDDVCSLAPDQEELAEQERARDMSAALDESVGSHGRVCANALCEVGLTHMRNHRCINETMSHADQQHCYDHDNRANQAIAEYGRTHRSDHDEADAAHRCTGEERHLGVLCAVPQARDIAA